jgi:hypothetical protein
MDVPPQKRRRTMSNLPEHSWTIAPELPVGSPERAEFFASLRETFVEDWVEAEEAAELDRRAAFGDLYFIRAGDSAVKIGRSGNVPGRLRHTQTHNHERLECVVVLKGQGWREKDYHRRFKDHRIHGDWFKRVPEIEAEIDRLANPREVAGDLTELG